MTVYAIAHEGLFKDIRVTTHAHREGADTWLTAQLEKAGNVVIAVEDLNFSGPLLVNLYRNLSANMDFNKFATKKDGMRRTFEELENRYRNQPNEIFNPVTAPTGSSGVNQEEGSSEEQSNEENTDMATKKKTKKAKKAKGERKPRTTALTVDLPTSLNPPAKTTSGCYIRSLIMLGKPTDRILELVKRHYPDGTTKASDVSWNRSKLRGAGKKIPAAE